MIQSNQVLKYEPCFRCGGTGLVHNDNGEPDCCRECKGNTVVRARDKKGRFT
jgi:DnaJ-class molecular chaperone